jgi:hypothetical protein
MRSLAKIDQVTLKKAEGYPQAVGIGNSPLLDLLLQQTTKNRKPELVLSDENTTN